MLPIRQLLLRRLSLVSLLLHKHPDHSLAFFRQRGAILLLALLRHADVQEETINLVGEAISSEDQDLDHHPRFAAQFGSILEVLACA